MRKPEGVYLHVIAKQDWLKAAVAIGYHLSCFLFTVNVIVVGISIFGGRGFPTRNIVLFIVAAVLWGIIGYFSEKVWWKECLSMLLYSFAMLGIFLFFLGLLLIIKSFTQPEIFFNIWGISAALVIGASMYFWSIKAMRSSFLN